MPAQSVSDLLPRVLRECGLSDLATAVESGRPLIARERRLVRAARVLAECDARAAEQRRQVGAQVSSAR